MGQETIMERLQAKCVRTKSGCLVWHGHLTDRGYGLLWVDGKNKRVHRLAWELVHGPIPDGLEIDHLCRNRACLEVSHLEPVTHRENVLRGQGPTAINARKRYCSKGHRYTPENTRVRVLEDGTRMRVCRECVRPKRRKKTS